MQLRPITLKVARRYVAEHHRHSRPPANFWLFGVGLENEAGELIGVAIASKPTARMLEDHLTIELSRICTDGSPNACSRLYGALCRAGAALGYERAVTYTLERESGSSVRAAGFTAVAHLGPRRSWSAPSRLRIESDLFGTPTVASEARVRWERQLSVTIHPKEVP